MSGEVILRSNQIVKHFGQTHALNGISVELRRGEIIGLIGENGSGKSTFSSIISGVYPPTSGTLELKGQEYKPTDPLDAQKYGISMVTQEMGTLPGIRVADNIFLGREDQFTSCGIVRRKAMNKAAKEAMARIGITDIDPDAPIAKYSLEDRKLIEVVRAVYADPEIFIVDETTTALSQRGRDVIYDLVKKFRDENKTVVFISHDLEEIMTVCTSIIVLRDGDLIARLEKDEFEEEKIKELMVGRKLTGSYYRDDYDGSHGDEVVLRAEGVYTAETLKDIHLELHKGEILGIGGLTDCGMHDLGKVLFGIEKPLIGKVRQHHGEHHASLPADAEEGRAGLPAEGKEVHQRPGAEHEHQMPGDHAGRAGPERRQQAEGRLRQVARKRIGHLHPGLPDAGHRHRRESLHVPADVQAEAGGQGDHHDLGGAAGADRYERPDPDHEGRRDPERI